MNREQIRGKVIDLNESNDIYMTLDIRLLTTRKNKNNATFTREFIDDIVSNKKFYSGMPLVAEKEKLERTKKNLTHGTDGDGNFKTDQIGSFVNFYAEEEEDYYSLFGTAKVFKRFDKTCESIIRLYQADKLFFSVEVLVSKYEKNKKNERVIGKYDGNDLFGDCIVSYPAEEDSKAELLIAEKEGEKMDKVKEFFEKAISVGTFELDLYQVQTKVFNKCRENKMEVLKNSYCSEFGTNYFIMQEYDTGNLFKVDYSVNNDEVDVSESYQVNRTYVKKESKNPEKMSDDLSDNVKKLTKSIDEKDNEIASLKDDLKKSNENLELVKKELEESSKDVIELNEKLDEQKKEYDKVKVNVDTLSESVIDKDKVIKELNEIKEKYDELQVEKAEQEKKDNQEALKEKYNTLLEKEVMESEEVTKAIDELDEDKLKDLVVNSALEKANKEKANKKNIDISQRINDDIDLENDIVKKYITIS